MGIPKFYRWLSERYPLLNQSVSINGAPELDNLYLDMNGIIHNCTHANDDDVAAGTKVVSEEQMMVKIIGYIDTLIQIIQPKQLVYMAIDGVAPRAKMNQQRSRRFRSAKDAKDAVEAAQRRGEPLPEGDRFDSNCITPGTRFMQNLTKHLHFMIRHKQTTDPVWQSPQVILSGHEIPGEGEHKIMEHIRWARLQPGYAPNQRHCLYGLDADLIMLSLVSHEPHFCLLREVVSFTGGGRGQPSREAMANPSEQSFILLHSGLLRDYIDTEFRDDTLPQGYSLERVIDDLICIIMLVGNDFLPPLPTLDINEGALTLLFGLYKEVIHSEAGYLTDKGAVHLGRLQCLLQKVGLEEAKTLEERARAAEEFAAKRQPTGDTFASELDDVDMAQVAAASAAAVAADELSKGAAEAEAEAGAGAGAGAASAVPEMMNAGRRNIMLRGGATQGALAQWKRSYYSDKLKVSAAEGAGVAAAVKHYVEGLCWTMLYYFRGVASWNWFFPYHYAPMASDMTGLADLAIEFDLGKPFLPFQQLMAVLPPASHKLLPPAYRHFMLDPSSPILDFYPATFELDHEGKRNDWEAVILVPFIDEPRLVAASLSVPADKLSEAERARNTLGNIVTFAYKPDIAYAYPSSIPEAFAGLHACKSEVTETHGGHPPLPADEDGFGGVIPGTTTGAGNPPGFPTLATLKHTGRCYNAGCNVFGQPTKRESMVLKLKDAGDAVLTAEMVGPAVVGKRCWVAWPHLQEGVIVAASDRQAAVRGDGRRRPHDAQAAAEWSNAVARCCNEYLSKRGIDVGHCGVMLHIKVCTGMVRQLDGAVRKQWAAEEALHPLQATLQQHPAPDPRLQEQDAPPVEQRYPAGTACICLSRSYYGCLAAVLPGASEQDVREGKLMVQCTLAAPASSQGGSSHRILQGVVTKFYPTGAVMGKLRVSGRVLGMVTSAVWILSGGASEEKVDVGLNLKHGGKNMVVPDYSRPAPSGKGWEYSEKAVALLQEYKAAFPWVFQGLDALKDHKEFQLPLRAFFPGEDQSKDMAVRQLYAARAWLKKHPVGRRGFVSGAARLAGDEAIHTMSMALPPPLASPPTVVLEGLTPSMLLLPIDAKTDTVCEVAGGPMELGDRVQCIVRGDKRPPFGSRGTVVGVHSHNAVEVVFDDSFMGGTDLQGRCAKSRGAYLKATDVMNLSQPPGSAKAAAPAPRPARPAHWEKDQAAAVVKEGTAQSAERRAAAAAAAERRAAAKAPSASQEAAAAALRKKDPTKGSQGKGKGKGGPSAGPDIMAMLQQAAAPTPTPTPPAPKGTPVPVSALLPGLAPTQPGSHPPPPPPGLAALLPGLGAPPQAAAGGSVPVTALLPGLAAPEPPSGAPPAAAEIAALLPGVPVSTVRRPPTAAEVEAGLEGLAVAEGTSGRGAGGGADEGEDDPVAFWNMLTGQHRSQAQGQAPPAPAPAAPAPPPAHSLPLPLQGETGAKGKGKAGKGRGKGKGGAKGGGKGAAPAPPPAPAAPPPPGASSAAEPTAEQKFWDLLTK